MLFVVHYSFYQFLFDRPSLWSESHKREPVFYILFSAIPITHPTVSEHRRKLHTPVTDSDQGKSATAPHPFLICQLASERWIPCLSAGTVMLIPTFLRSLLNSDCILLEYFCAVDWARQEGLLDCKKPAVKISVV